MEEIFRQGGRLRKPHFRKLLKHIDGSFYWSLDSRRSLAQFLQAQGWNIVECPSEADIMIAKDCTAKDVVISGDSDSLIYASIKTIWRPLARGRYLAYDVQMLLKQLEMSRAGLTVLGIVSRNDYSTNLTRMGVSTNYSIIQPFGDADPDTILQAYLDHGEVASKHASKTHFDAALKIFVRQQFTVEDCIVSSQVSNQEDATQDPVQRTVTLENVLQRLKDLRLQLIESKKKSFIGGQAEERPRIFNRYNTIDHPPSLKPPPHSSGRKYKYRERYAIKTRLRVTKHEPPDILKQYTWKPWTARPESPRESTTSTSRCKRKDKPAKPLLPVELMTKKDLVLALQWEHPTRTLEVGTINANVSRALKQFPAPLQDDYFLRIKTCLTDITRLAARSKRTCQRLIGQYLEQLSLHGVDEVDKIILDKLCPPFSVQDVANYKNEDYNSEQSEDSQENQELDASNDNSNHPLTFFMVLLNTIYSSKPPPSTGKTGPVVRMFMDKAKDFLPQQTQAVKYPGSSFLRSAAVQLTVEFRKHFKNGSIDLCKKIECLKKKGLLPHDAVDRIDSTKSSVENFITLNRTSGSRRCLVPMSSFEDKFVTVSELDLTKIFWQDEVLKRQLQHFAHPDFPSIETPDKIAQADVALWIGRVEPGYLINKLLTDIGGYSVEQRKKGYSEEEEGRRRKLKNYSRSTMRMSIEKLKEHVRAFRQDDFNPVSYTARGYVLRGSVRTDGFRLQLLGFKLNELNCVKYRRLPAERLPPRLTSTLGGTDFYLTEIRNVVASKDDVVALWGCDPRQIKILGIDLGQAFVVGASAILPSSKQPTITNRQESKEGAAEKDIASKSTKFYNLSVKQKA
ncbi:hypothetical protein BGZ81_009264, partial [Podila clonocystis]